MSYYNEYAVIPTTTPKHEQYLPPSRIPQPQYIGSRGDICNARYEYHEPLWCVDNKCDDWAPTINTQPMNGPTNEGSRIEKFASVPGVDFYQLSPDYEDFPNRGNVSKTLQYTSSQKANSGRNYWM